MFLTESVGAYMMYLHTKSNEPSSSGSLTTTARLKVKHVFRASTVNVLHSTKEIALTKAACFSKLYYHTEFQNVTQNEILK
jgi:hypothetical protein